MFNIYLKQYGLKIRYIPRVKNKKGRWIIKNLYLPVNPIEPVL